MTRIRRAALLTLAALAGCEGGGTPGGQADTARPSFFAGTTATPAPTATMGLALSVDSPAVATSGWTVVVRYQVKQAGDSLLVTAQRAENPEYAPLARYKNVRAGASYSRTVSVAPTLAAIYTFRARLWRGGLVTDSASASMAVGVTAPASPPALSVLAADTSVSTRTAGDTTFTTTRIVTTRGVTDTAVTVTYTVKPPPPTASTMPLDSVTASGFAVVKTDTTLIAFNPHAWPYPQAGASMSGRVLVDGVPVASLSQVPLYTTVRMRRPAAKTVTITVCVAVRGALPTSAERCSRGYAYTDGSGVSSAPPSPPVTEPPVNTLPAGVIFADNFASGGFGKVGPDGFHWGDTPQGSAWVDVVGGFSKDGNTGHAVRFTFKGHIVSASTGDYNAWAQLAFRLGQPVTELWQTFWLYFPKGGETIAGVVQPPWENRGRFTPDFMKAGNNKFSALYEAYENIAGAPMHLTQTWNDYIAPGDPVWIPANRPSGSVTKHRWANHPAFTPMTTGRGRWAKIELHDRLSSAPGVADGVAQIFVDGQELTLGTVRDFDDLALTPAPGITGKFLMGYLLGYENAAADGIHYAYLSHYAASAQRLTDAQLAALW